MSLASGKPARRPRRFWLAMVGAALVAVLLGVAYVQWREAELLEVSSNLQNDALGWSFSQLETEHLRLRNQMQLALADGEPIDAEAIQLRYDIFVSRLGLVDHERAAHIMEGRANYAEAIAQVRAFVAQADRYLGAGNREPLTLDAVRRLLPALDQLTVPLHDLSLGASHLLYERVSQRNSAIREQSRLGVALTLSLCVLMLALAAIVLRQFRALDERGRSLEELAENLSRARQEAEAASRAKSVFLANMSHEIRTPFHGLLGMMSLLKDTQLTAQQKGYLNTARDSAHHLLEILNDILDISKLESGKLQVAPEAVDLMQLLSQVEALMRVQAQAKGLALQMLVAPDVPRWVRADPTRVKQILFNLLSNAVKFSSHGAVRLAVSGGGHELRFAVADTGSGMDEETKGRLFQRFVQGDETTSRRHGGTGLGLEISRNLARLMGGDITVESSPGRGSTFTATLSLPPATPPAEPPAVALPADGEPARRLRVLVAEDHPVNRAYMEAVLDKLGHDAVFSEDGAGAVEAASRQDFDIVLMDLHMPVMDGFTAARAIRALPPPHGKVPIIALTADAFQESRDLAREVGMDGFLTKPAHLPQLHAALQRHAGQAPLSAPAAPAPDGDAELDRATMDDVRRLLTPARYAALLDDFFAGPTLDALRAAIQRGDVAAMRDQAHALRGAALSLGLRKVAEAADALRHGDAAPTETLAAGFAELERHLQITRDLCISLGLLRSDAASA
ncbi:MAG: response regulator [Proteobacteria bacterium]|nr:response regulator [Pseudomonadota bacterium]